MLLKFLSTTLLVTIAICVACSRPDVSAPGGSPSSLAQVPAVRLNFRYEPDVPPADLPREALKEERNAALQADFDANRPQEVLDMTFTSPDSKRVLAVYHKAGDLPAEFRLDMYATEGRILRKIT